MCEKDGAELKAPRTIIKEWMCGRGLSRAEAFGYAPNASTSPMLNVATPSMARNDATTTISSS